MFLDIFWIKMPIFSGLLGLPWFTHIDLIPKWMRPGAKRWFPAMRRWWLKRLRRPGCWAKRGRVAMDFLGNGEREKDELMMILYYFVPFISVFFVGRIWDEGFVGVCEGKLQGNWCVSSEIDGLGIRVRAERETQVPTPLLGTGWSRKIIEDERCVVYPLVN